VTDKPGWYVCIRGKCIDVTHDRLPARQQMKRGETALMFYFDGSRILKPDYPMRITGLVGTEPISPHLNWRRRLIAWFL
jgi:hypothetical protein